MSRFDPIGELTHVKFRRHAVAVPAALVALSLTLAACGGDKEPDAKEPAGKDAPAAPATWPLTGLEVPEGADAAQDHPVLVVKIDNTAASAPQAGLSSADLVVEELVEGGITRLAAFYYSAIPGQVGPVRSMRASDIGIVAPAEATVVTSGAAPITLKRLKNAGVEWVTEGSAGFFRATDRSQPYNLLADLRKAAKALEDGKKATPNDYLPWGEAADLPEGKPASSIKAHFGSRQTDWTYSAKGGYTNVNSNAPANDQFPAETVLVLRVQVGDAGYKDPAGNPVPETKLTGSGDALLFHGGKVVTGTWTKDAEDAALSLSTPEGELKVPAGRVWIELVPVDSANGSVSYTK